MAMPVIPKERRKDPSGSRIFAIGDIHGCYDSLVEMINKIEEYARAENDYVVFLGDYVDKGPNSADVIDLLIEYKNNAPDNVKILMGNHDYHFATFHKNWIKNKQGRITLESYRKQKVTSWFRNNSYNPYDNVRIAKHRKFLKNLPHYWDTEKLLFVHAGVDPDKELWEQHAKTLIFIREKFLSKESDTGHKYVVHGHHKIDGTKVDVRKKRINLDTGCYETGVLSCGVFNKDTGELLEVLQTKGKTTA